MKGVRIFKLLGLDILGVIVMPSICFVIFLTFFLNKSTASHGGVVIYLAGYWLFSFSYVLPLLVIFSLIHENISLNSKFLIKIIPISIWLLFTFGLQSPIFNVDTEYKVFNSNLYSLLYLMLSGMFVFLYSKKLIIQNLENQE